jgi:hypothetical protein
MSSIESLHRVFDGAGLSVWQGEQIKLALRDQATMRDLIALVRPLPEADANGDVHCLRLWPVAHCDYVSGHYGGCNPR